MFIWKHGTLIGKYPVVVGYHLFLAGTLYGTAVLLYDKLPILFLLVGIFFIYFWFLNTKKLENNLSVT
jgi:hypothetical protein